MTIEEIEEILLVISDKSENEKKASDAFSDLYRGYSRYVGKVISNALKQMGIYDKHLLETVMNNVFIKLYENPLNFSFREKAIDDKSFKGWLATVSKNELKGLIKDYYDITSSLEIITSEPKMDSEEVPEEFFESINTKTLNSALNTLSERDKHILRTLYFYYEEGKDTPSDVLDMLCKTHDTTKSNIRQIKRRSEKKIIDYFAKHTELKPLKNVK